MRNDLTTSGLWLLSDLHLAPPSELLEFRSARALAALLHRIATAPRGQLLVCNGDIFDYLQLPGYDSLDLPQSAQRTRVLLDGIAVDVLAGLIAVLRAGHRLLLVPGNHDPEIGLAAVHDVLRARLGGDADNLLVHLSSEPWRVQVGARTVLGTHGHRGDPWNDLTVEQVLAAQAHGEPQLRLPPGSRLVIEVVNRFRRATAASGSRRFDFVDLVKPDTAAALLLLHVDPRLAVRQLLRAAIPTSRALARSLGKLLRRGANLAPSDPRPQKNDELAVDAIASELASAMTDGERKAVTVVESAVADLDTDELEAAPGGLSMRTWFPTLARRAFVRAMQRAQIDQAPDRPDGLAKAAIARMPTVAGSVFLTGHTHAAKWIRLDGDRHYLNTGTWQDTVDLPSQAAPDWEQWVDHLLEGAVPRTQRRHFAYVTADRVVLDEVAD